MSMSSTFRLFSPKIPLSLQLASSVSKTHSFSSLPPPNSPRFSTVTFQRLTTTPIAASPSPPPPSSVSSSDPLDESFPPSLQHIIQLFQSVENPRSKYEQLLFYGRNLPPLRSEFKTPENKVQGCVSQVWVHAFLDSDGRVKFEADSDSALTKGLAALLVQGLSSLPPSDIVRVSPEFVQLLGLRQSLTPSRNNGFLNMLRLMQKKALQLYVEAEELADSSTAAESEVKGSNLVEDSVGSSKPDANSNGFLDNSVGKAEDVKEDSEMNLVAEGGKFGTRRQRISERLTNELRPVELEVEDISYQHAGHAAVRGSGDGETHFNVRVVSEEFEGKSMVKRHRLIYDLLREELQGGLHALSIVAKTPAEAGSR